MINPVIYPITLDVYKTGSQKVLSMVRGDNKRVISVALTENDKPYIITEGCTAKFTALKPDGNFIYNDCEIDFKNNTINYQVTDQTTAVNGIVACQIRLIGANGSFITTPSFTMVVSDLLYNEEPIVDSSNEFNALTRFLADLQYKLDNGEFNGKSIYIKGSVSDVSELDAKIPYVVAGDGYIAGDDHLYVFDGTAFVDVGAVRGPQGLSGVYVGNGDMPEGYDVQIDPDGAAYEMDTELNAESQNPVTNSAITKAINEHSADIENNKNELGKKLSKSHINGTADVTNVEEAAAKYLAWYAGLGNNEAGRYVISIDGSYRFVDIYKTNANYGVIMTTLYSAYGATVEYASVIGGVLGEFIKNDLRTQMEVLSPNMNLNSEYYTLDKFLGKTVYAKIISVNSSNEVVNDVTSTCSLSVNHGISNLEYVKSISAIHKNEDSFMDMASFSGYGLSVNAEKVQMTYDGRLGSGTVYVELKYTKG